MVKQRSTGGWLGFERQNAHIDIGGSLRALYTHKPTNSTEPRLLSEWKNGEELSLLSLSLSLSLHEEDG